ncbi:MAG: transglutaminase-like cysteine peptidase [Rhizobiaceae bacterium]
MTTIRKLIIATGMALGVISTQAVAQGISHMKTGSVTSQPIGHAMFCKQHPRECRVRSRANAAPKLTRKRWADLVKVNNHANFSVTPVTDQDAYGVEEHWTYPRSFGDCEDYVLLKRYLLLQRGWPASSLLITVVKQPNGDGHAVLTVRTSKADYVLDNLETKIKPWNKTRYRFLKRQSTRHTGKWTAISDTRSQVARY